MQRLRDLVLRFRKDERGVFMVLFAILALVLIATSGAVVDFTKTEQARTRAQTALDSAALALQTQITTQTNAQLQAKAQTILTERLADATITAVVTGATKDATAGTLNLQAYITVPTAFVQLVGINSIRSNLTSEVTRGSKDIEVSLSLDITGSMLGTKIADLITASNSLIDLVVKTTQTPTYSKMAIVPWSFAVNVGSTYSNAVRGTPTPGSVISNASWMSGTSKTISGVTKANPAVVTTSAAHGFAVDDYVFISNVAGMTNLNNNIYKVNTVTSTTKFSLKTTANVPVNSSAWTAFSATGSPKVTKCLNSSCQVLITTATNHGQVAGDTVYITGATGITTLNGTHVGKVGVVPNTTSFYLTDQAAAAVLYNTYTANSATTYCTVYGCTYQYFTDASGTTQTYQVNDCVTERTTNAYTDTAPSTTKLGFNYRSAGDPCVDQLIVPLTSNKTTLHNLVNSLVAGGSTAGHLGLAWGWYMIAPNFSYLWPAASQPAAYNTPNLVKAVIFMTDGDFNTPYCQGVIASDALSGSGSSNTHINCASPNGTSKSQAQSLCDAIKVPANNTLLYVVGFDLAGNNAALTFLQNCATAPAYFFQADTGADLATAFAAIAQQLSDLRVSK